jgi:uncharacterized delta-60 repeat protein
MSFRSRLRPAGVVSCARRHPTGKAARGQGAGGRVAQPFEALEGRRLFSATLLMSGLASLQGAPSESYVDEGDYQLTLSALSLPAGVTVTQWNIDWDGNGATDQTIAGNGSSSVSVTRNLDGDALIKMKATATLSDASVVTGESRSPSGDLDNTFAGGVVSGGDGVVLGTAVDSQGRTVVVYNHKDFSSGDWQIKLRRYGKDCSLDTAFGTPTVPFDYTQFGDDAAILAQGEKIVVGGTTRSLANLPGDNYDFAVARFDSTGALDTGFGVGGRQVVQVPGNDGITALTFQGGRIVAAGQGAAGAGASDFQLARFTSEGLLDATFGTGGYLRTSVFQGQGATDVAVTADGGLAAAGRAFDTTLATFKPLVVKYGANGAEQWRSGAGVPGGFGFKASLAVQADGGIVLAGDVDNDVTLTRLAPSTGAVEQSLTEPTPDSETVDGVALGGDGALLVAVGTTDGGSFSLNRYSTSFGGIARDFMFGAGAGSVGVTFAQQGRPDSLAVTPGGSFVLAGSTGSLDNFSQTQPTVNVVHFGGDLQALVQDVAPQVVQVGTLAGVPGQTQQVRVFDPSNADTAAGFFGYIDYDFHGEGDEDGVNFGWDPNTGEFFGAAFTTLVYTVNGNYNVLAQIGDKDGQMTFIQPDGAEFGVDSITYSIGKTARLADPVNPGKTVLFVGTQDDATTGAGVANTIKFSRSTTGSTTVTVDGVNTTFTQAVDRIVVYGNGGDDTIQPQGTVSIPVEIYGGAGNDKIKGGTGADVLVGGDGDDLITGGVGRNFMVGGLGADKVIGDVDDDILVGGTYSRANDRAATNAVMAEWTSSRTYPQRVDNLRNGTGANGTVRLVGLSGGTAQTVFDDGAVDKLTGDLATDWFFANVDGTVKDKIADLAGNEFTDSDRLFVTSV